jgi:hypothetical protein
MTNPDPSRVWHAILDDRFFCRVIRLSGAVGILRITDRKTGRDILEQDVVISEPGPEASDIASYRELCEKAIDAE